jgi:hypothetical protein
MTTIMGMTMAIHIPTITLIRTGARSIPIPIPMSGMLMIMTTAMIMPPRRTSIVLSRFAGPFWKRMIASRNATGVSFVLAGWWF